MCIEVICNCFPSLVNLFSKNMLKLRSGYGAAYLNILITITQTVELQQLMYEIKLILYNYM